MVFAGKELREITRTWRLWVLPGIVLVFALSGPVVAEFTPQIVGAAVGNQIQGLKVPTPTYVDSYAQWIKNLSQIVGLALLIIYGGLVSGEVRSGTAALVLTKPLSRTAFVLAKAFVQSSFLIVLTSIGAVITWLLTMLIFGNAPAGPLWSGTLAWLVIGILFIGLMTLLSVLVGSAAGASGIGLAVFALLVLAAIWQPLGTYSPAALTTLPAKLITGGSADVTWPIATAAISYVLLVSLAAWRFRHRDL